MAITFVLSNGQQISAPVKQRAGGANVYAKLYADLEKLQPKGAIQLTADHNLQTTPKDGEDLIDLAKRNVRRVGWYAKDHAKKLDKQLGTKRSIVVFNVGEIVYMGCESLEDAPVEAK